MRFVLAALMVVGAVAPASAGRYCADYVPPRRVCNAGDGDAWAAIIGRSCTTIRGYCRQWSYSYEPRVYGYERREREITLESDVRRRHCSADSVRVVGVERYGTERAKEAADGQWMETVRANFGGKMMDLRNAKHVSYECWQSSTGNRASEKAADVGGKFLEQCELRAIPCRASRVEDDRR